MTLKTIDYAARRIPVVLPLVVESDGPFGARRGGGNILEERQADSSANKNLRNQKKQNKTNNKKMSKQRKREWEVEWKWTCVRMGGHGSSRNRNRKRNRIEWARLEHDRIEQNRTKYTIIMLLVLQLKNCAKERALSRASVVELACSAHLLTTKTGGGGRIPQHCPFKEINCLHCHMLPW